MTSREINDYFDRRARRLGVPPNEMVRFRPGEALDWRKIAENIDVLLRNILKKDPDFVYTFDFDVLDGLLD